MFIYKPEDMIVSNIIDGVISPKYSYDTQHLSCDCEIYEHGSLNKVLHKGLVVMNKRNNTIKLQADINTFRNITECKNTKTIKLDADDYPPYYSIVLHGFDNKHADNNIEVLIHKCSLNGNFYISFDTDMSNIENELDIYYEDGKLITFYVAEFKNEVLDKLY